MATIELLPHNERTGTWILVWTEHREQIGRVLAQEDGHFIVVPQGPHWSPMKSFAGNTFNTPDDALREVQLYFAHR